MAVDAGQLAELVGRGAGRAEKAAEEAYAAIGGDRVNLASPQATARGAVRPPWHAEDQEDQDRLHDGRRVARRPLREATAPVPRGAARASGRVQAGPDHRDACAMRCGADGRIHTTFSQIVAVDGQARLQGSEPAKHPDSHRGGPPHSRGLRRGRRASRRSSPPTTSQIEMRIMAHLSGDAALIDAFKSTARTCTVLWARACLACPRRA